MRSQYSPGCFLAAPVKSLRIHHHGFNAEAPLPEKQQITGAGPSQRVPGPEQNGQVKIVYPEPVQGNHDSMIPCKTGGK